MAYKKLELYLDILLCRNIEMMETSAAQPCAQAQCIIPLHPLTQHSSLLKNKSICMNWEAKLYMWLLERQGNIGHGLRGRATWYNLTPTSHVHSFRQKTT